MAFSSALTTIVGVLGLANLLLTLERDPGESEPAVPPAAGAVPEPLPTSAMAPDPRS